MGLPSRYLTGLFSAALCAGLLAACTTTSDTTTSASSVGTSSVATSDAGASTDAGTGTVAHASASTGTSGGSGLFGNLFHKNDGKPKGVVTVPSDSAYSTDLFLKAGYCPPVQIRPDTEALILYVKGHEDDPNYVRYQASIGDIARECHASGPDTLTLKVGIAGRIAAGPQGGAGNVAATLRVAVVKQHGNTVLFSQPYKVVSAIAPPDFSTPFAEVADNITLKLTSDDRDLIIFVGFDEGKPKPKPTG